MGQGIMATSKNYLIFVLEQLSGLDVSYRGMMGEYIIYYRGKIAAYLCDNRFLVKPTPSAMAMLPDARQEAPYDGAKMLLLVENVDDKNFLTELFEATYEDLPEPKPKKVSRR